MAGNLNHSCNEFGKQKSEESYAEWQKFWLNYRENQNNTAFYIQNQHNSEMPEDCLTYNQEQIKERWCFALRHGERVDLTYGKWTPYCFDENGVYERRDLNMPPCLPLRDGGKDSYEWDSPLTLVGRLQARSVGEGLRDAGVMLHHVYSSPALRCIETAHNLILGLGDTSLKIKIEPALFEQTIWHLNKGTGLFMTLDELHAAGYNVDVNYTPFSKVDMKNPENLQECYNRTSSVMQKAIAETEKEGGNIIFVGHAMTLQVMALALQQLDNKNEVAYTEQTMHKFLDRVPYCGLCAMKSNKWRLVEPPCPPFMNSSSGRFDWKILL